MVVFFELVISDHVTRMWVELVAGSRHPTACEHLVEAHVVDAGNQTNLMRPYGTQFNGSGKCTSPPFQENGKHTFTDLLCLTRMLKLTAAVVIEGANRK